MTPPIAGNSRRHNMLVLLAAAAAATAATVRAQAPSGGRWNVLMIVLDDLNGNVGAMGDTLARTPNIDRLVARGLLLTNHHVQVSECSPSRVSMLSGLRPDEIKVFAREASFRRRNPGAVTLPGLLRTKGYTTVSIGKVFDWPAFSEQDSAGGRPIELCREDFPRTPDMASACSFDKYFSTLYIRKNRCVCPKTADTPYPFGPSPNNAHIPLVWGETQTKFTDELAWDDCHANTAIWQLQHLSSKPAPWFLAVGFFRPHLPWAAPKRFFDMYGNGEAVARPVLQAGLSGDFFSKESQEDGRYDSQEIVDYIGPQGHFPKLAVDSTRRVRGYYASTSFVDYEIGRLVDALDATPNAAGNTLVVLWSDNGFHLGPAVWGKKTVYESATRTPLAVIPPRNHRLASQARGKVSSSPVESIDIYPTVLDVLGVSKLPSQYLHGVSLVPLMQDPSRLVKQAAMTQYRSIVMPMQRMGYTLRTRRFRLIAYFVFDGACWAPSAPCNVFAGRSSTNKVELYDLGEPGYLVGETKNVAGDPAYAAELQRLLGYLDTKTPSMSMLNGGTEPPVSRPTPSVAPPTPRPSSSPPVPSPVKGVTGKPVRAPTSSQPTPLPTMAPVDAEPPSPLPTNCRTQDYRECIARGCVWKKNSYYAIACRVPGAARGGRRGRRRHAQDEQPPARECSSLPTKHKCRAQPGCSWVYKFAGRWGCESHGITSEPTPGTRAPTAMCADMYEPETSSPTQRAGVPTVVPPPTPAPEPVGSGGDCRDSRIQSNCLRSPGCVWKRMGWKGFRCVAGGG